MTAGKCVLEGGLRGALVWAVYGVVEFVFTGLFPLITISDTVLTPWYWKVTAVLLGAYFAVGMCLGALAGLALRAISRRTRPSVMVRFAGQCDAAAGGVLVLAFAAQLLVSSPAAKSTYWELFVCSLLVLVLISSAISDRCSRWFNPLISPWLLSCQLLISPWILGREPLRGRSTTIRLAACAALLVVVWLAALLVSRIRAVNRTLAAPGSLARNFIQLAAAAICLVVAGMLFSNSLPPDIPVAGANSDRPSGPNIVLVVLDTVRADHLSLYGYQRRTSPNLEALARQATVYTRVISTGDMTLSSHASFFTGLYAGRHGAHASYPGSPLGQALAPGFETLAEILSQRGYLTLGVAANYLYLGKHYGLGQGFRFIDARQPIALFSPIDHYYLRNGVRRFLSIFFSTLDFDRRYRRAEEINRDVFGVLDQTKRLATPFFLFVNYMDAHDPYTPPPPFDTLFPGKRESLTYEYVFKLTHEVVALKRVVTREERNHFLSQYDGGIAYLDSEIAKLLRYLKATGRFEDILLIITSDHGEAFGERNLIIHGCSSYQDQVHIPLVVKYPNQQQGQVDDRLASGADLMPTVLDVLGYPQPEKIDGQSLRALKRNLSRSIFAESFGFEWLFAAHPRFRHVERAAFIGSMKLIASTSGKRELYDLSKDPNEKVNLYEPDSVASNELRARLTAFIHDADNQKASRPSDIKKPDRETLERLRSLGYVQ